MIYIGQNILALNISTFGHWNLPAAIWQHLKYIQLGEVVAIVSVSISTEIAELDIS